MSGMQCGTLYLCATPIGNLEDITLRAIRILKECDIIAAEDTRHTRKLLAHFDIHTPLTSYHAHNEESKGEQLLAKLKQGQNIAVVSDAGMPGISDPGYELVKSALENGISVVPVPGANAAVTALVASGLPTARFVFEGFLPANKKGRRRQLEKMAQETRTIIFYESPHRIKDTLSDLIKIFGERQIAVARELTKKHEEIYRGKLSGALEYFSRQAARGEFTLVVAGAEKESAAEKTETDNRSITEQLKQLMQSGLDKKQAIKEVAKMRGVSKRDIYKEAVDIDR